MAEDQQNDAETEDRFYTGVSLFRITYKSGETLKIKGYSNSLQKDFLEYLTTGIVPAPKRYSIPFRANITAPAHQLIIDFREVVSITQNPALRTKEVFE